MNLKLLSRLQGTDSVSLILDSEPGGILNYFLIARSVSYDVVCSGQIPGTIVGDQICFDIRLSSIIPLVEKGVKFNIVYNEDVLKFVSEDGIIEVVPSYVEHNDPAVFTIIDRYLKFTKFLEDRDRVKFQLEQAEKDLVALKRDYRDTSTLHLSGGPSSDPFTPDDAVKKIDEFYLPKIEEQERRVSKLKSEDMQAKELDLSAFIPLAYSASRGHNLVEMCGDYAIVDLNNSFLLQKGECPIQSIQGQLLYNLLRNGGGKGFYIFEGNVVYLSDAKESTVVFIQSYLPNISVDSSIVTRGAVEEKYSIKLKGALDSIGAVKHNFPTLSMDMGKGCFNLLNDLGEKLIIKFEVEDAKTVQLMKMMKGIPVQGAITMSVIDIPNEVQSNLFLFKDKLVIYIKKRKIIFQNKNLYLVFGR